MSVISKEAPRDDSLRNEILDHLHRLPSDSESTQSTVSYCEGAISLVLTRIARDLSAQYPLEIFAEKIERIQKVGVRPQRGHSVEVDGRIYLQVPGKERLIGANSLITSLHYANPNLTPFEYAIKLYPYKDRRQEPASATEPSKGEQLFPESFKRQNEPSRRYPGFNQRLSHLVQAGEWSLKDPQTKIIAIAFISQVARNDGVNLSRQLLGRVANFGGLLTAGKIDPFLDEIFDKVRVIRKHEAFITFASGILKEMAQNDLLGRKIRGKVVDQDRVNERITLLTDLAFMDTGGLGADGLKYVIEEMARSITDSSDSIGWSAAMGRRDYLLRFCAGSFPEWRQNRFRQEFGGRIFKNRQSLVRAIKEEGFKFEPDDVPYGLRPLFEYVAKLV